mgnify:FL=1
MPGKTSSKCIKVYKELGNNAINILKEMGLLNQDLRPRKEGNYLLIPIVNEKSLNEIGKFFPFEICNELFEEYKFKSKRLILI